jgi:hypothetical protein
MVDDLDFVLTSKQSLSVNRLKVRPLCLWCDGDDWRKGYTHCKAVSRRLNDRSRKPRYKDH